MSELLNSASKDNLPLLINTFTGDVAKNGDIYCAGNHYSVPGIYVISANVVDVAKSGKAVVDYIRSGKGPAILQVHTYCFMGHSLADTEH